MVAAARATDAGTLLAEHRRVGVEVLIPGDAAWPSALDDDPEPPAALFVRGDATLLAQVSVAIVGTRRCSGGGAHVAGSLAAGLADAGVPVVSGLALGIDGAAHRGALAAGGRPVGVVATGLDRVYPGRHHQLWGEVAAAGVLVSEAPLGVGPERWRFPARNRLIAALASVVVVVESRRRGGSMTTADAALERDRPVLAVPGSVLAEQSTGTNQLLAEGAGVVRDVADVLVALGSAAPVRTPTRAPSGPELASSPPATEGEGEPISQAVAAVLGPTPVRVEAIAAASGTSVAEAVTALAVLEAAGRVRRVGGGYEGVLA
jgi:DNA processing protein